MSKTKADRLFAFITAVRMTLAQARNFYRPCSGARQDMAVGISHALKGSIRAIYRDTTPKRKGKGQAEMENEENVLFAVGRIRTCAPRGNLISSQTP